MRLLDHTTANSTKIVRYEWDEINRMKSYAATSGGARYEYRADGMRTLKVEGLSIQWVQDNPQIPTPTPSGHYDSNWSENMPTTRYFYDGQMCMEEDYTTGTEQNPVVDVTRYGLGARGIDYIEETPDGGSATASFPCYDGHGNMIATLSRTSTDIVLGNKRYYDAWGSVRTGSATGDPKGRYVANLGHLPDDESGLLYMRARYYEPVTGRFLSQDPARDGINWYGYCWNNPISGVDPSGELYLTDSQLTSMLTRLCTDLMYDRGVKIMCTAALLMLQAWLTHGILRMPYTDYQTKRKLAWISTFKGEVDVSNTIGIGSVKDKARAVADAYAIMLFLTMWVMFEEDDFLFKN